MVLVRQRLGLLSIPFVCAKAPFRPAQWSKVQPLQQLRRFRSTPATTPVPDPVAHPILEPATKLAAGPVETPGIFLREYQEECIQAVLQYLRKGHKRLGVSLATGSGKTVIFTQLISRIPPRNERGDKTLILVHRRELVEQAARHCRLAYPNKSVEVEMGNNAAKGSADIVVASVQSLLSKDRIFKFAPNMFKLVLVDEAHHIVAKSYRQILQYFGLNEANADSPALVGVSATFSRSDGLKLGAAIDHIVYHKDYVDMIDEKWLSNAVFTTVQSKADLSKVKKDSFGDFALGSLSKAVNTNMTNSVTVRAWMANAQGRSSTLVFCVDVEHTQSLTQTFREYGIDARYITASTPRQVRGEQLQAFKDQEFPVLLNCGLFTEGTDIPNIDCVLLARPTKSRNLLIQMIGRGLRLFPGKENCHIIDMVATLETGVISTPTLFGLHPDEVLSGSSAVEIREGIDKATKDANADATKANRTTLGPTPVTEQELANARAVEDGIKVKFTHYDTITDLVGDMRSGDRHIRTLSPYAWVRTGDDDRYVLSDRNGWITIRKGQDKDIDTSTYSDTSDTPITASNIYTVTHVLKITPFKNNNDDNDDNDLESRTRKKPFFTRPRLIAKTPDLETAVRAADTYAPNVFNEHYISTRPAWRAAPATSAQIQMLNRAKLKQKGLLRYSDLTRGQAADMITKLKFGGKSRFSAMRKVRLKREEARGKLEETIRLGMTGVQVGPVQM